MAAIYRHTSSNRGGILMVSGLRPIHPSRFRRAVYIVFTLVVSSYISFDVIDLDRSDFFPLFNPIQEPDITAVASSKGELFNSPELLTAQDSTLVRIAGQLGKLTSPKQARLLILSSLHSARAHGYRVSLARNSLPDSSPYY